MHLTHAVAESGIGGERRSLVENWFAHCRAHRFARLVIAEFEILADFAIRYVLETGDSERSMREEGCKFDESEMVRCKHVKRVAKEFIRACPEVIERPAPFQNLGELRNADEIWGIKFQRIEPNRDERVSRFYEHKLVTQMAAKLSLASIHSPQKKWRSVTV